MENQNRNIRRYHYSSMHREKSVDEVLRYLALIASDVTSGKLNPAMVNWRYVRSQITDAIHHLNASGE